MIKKKKKTTNANALEFGDWVSLRHGVEIRIKSRRLQTIAGKVGLNVELLVNSYNNSTTAETVYGKKISFLIGIASNEKKLRQNTEVTCAKTTSCAEYSMWDDALKEKRIDQGELLVIGQTLCPCDGCRKSYAGFAFKKRIHILVVYKDPYEGFPSRGAFVFSYVKPDKVYFVDDSQKPSVQLPYGIRRDT
jgi:hypothetical protein